MLRYLQGNILLWEGVHYMTDSYIYNIRRVIGVSRRWHYQSVSTSGRYQTFCQWRRLFYPFGWTLWSRFCTFRIRHLQCPFCHKIDVQRKRKDQLQFEYCYPQFIREEITWTWQSRQAFLQCFLLEPLPLHHRDQSLALQPCRTPAIHVPSRLLGDRLYLSWLEREVIETSHSISVPPPYLQCPLFSVAPVYLPSFLLSTFFCWLYSFSLRLLFLCLSCLIVPSDCLFYFRFSPFPFVFFSFSSSAILIHLSM